MLTAAQLSGICQPSTLAMLCVEAYHSSMGDEYVASGLTPACDELATLACKALEMAYADKTDGALEAAVLEYGFSEVTTPILRKWLAGLTA